MLLKLSATVLDTSEAAVAAAASNPPVPAYRECLVFALNAVGIYAAPTLMSLIDAAFVGRVSTTQLAALGPASLISDSAPFFLLFVSIAATNLVAKAHAAKDQAGTARVARTSVAFARAGGPVLAAVTMLSATTLSRFYCGGNAAVLAPLCARYVGIRVIGLPAVVVASVAQAVLVGMKDTKTPMLSPSQWPRASTLAATSCSSRAWGSVWRAPPGRRSPHRSAPLPSSSAYSGSASC